MSMNNNNKLDLLWKKHKGVAPTSPKHREFNERFRSSTPLMQQNFWSDSDRIPSFAPSVNIPTGNEIWAPFMVPHKRTRAVRMLVDNASQQHGWVAVRSIENGFEPTNRLTNWIPSTYHSTYTVVVWAGNPENAEFGPAVRLSPDAEGQEWEFDYSSGVLHFPNDVPPVVKQSGVWVEGWRYTGGIGRDSGEGSEIANRIRTFSFTSGTLTPGQHVDFTFATGGVCTLVEAKTSMASILECHAVSTRTDTNPYRFIAIASHLVDDGSYVINGIRYYGDRFVKLVNMDAGNSDLTYWRVYNDSGSAGTITVIIRVTG